MDVIKNPKHYNTGGIECIDYIRDSLGPIGFAYYCEGNVKKYMHRFRYKNQDEDLQKAEQYLEWLKDGYTTVEDDGNGNSGGHEVHFKSRRDDGSS